MKIKVSLLYEIMQTIERRRIRAGISYDTPLNNRNKTMHDILKAIPFKNVVKPNEYKLILKNLNDFECFNVNESVFQQSAIDLHVEKDDKTKLGHLCDFIRIIRIIRMKMHEMDGWVTIREDCEPL